MSNPVRLYLDEDAQRASLVRALRGRQYDVLTSSDAQKAGANDAEQLIFAISQQRTVFTFNRGDFARLHADYMNDEQTHAGIIVSDQLEAGVIIRRLLKLLHARSAEDMTNWLEFLSNWR
jgi:hypothetical protein